jgi:hypothetical protein
VSTVAVARAPAQAARVVATAFALARIEGIRLVRHPIVLAGLALAILLAYRFPLGNEIGGKYFLLMGMGVLPLGFAAFVVANLAALRTERSETGELFTSLSAPASVRTLAHLVSLVYAVVFCAAVVAAGYVAFGAWDGIVVDSAGKTAEPSPYELANGPAAAAALGALGVALARWLPYLPVAPLAAVAVFVVQVTVMWGSERDYAWFVPFVNTARSDVPGASWPCSPDQGWPCGVDEFATTSAGWHVVYLAGIALILGAAALWKEDRRPRIAAAAALGGVLVVAGGTLQLS